MTRRGRRGAAEAARRRSGRRPAVSLARRERYERPGRVVDLARLVAQHVVTVVPRRSVLPPRLAHEQARERKRPEHRRRQLETPLW